MCASAIGVVIADAMSCWALLIEQLAEQSMSVQQVPGVASALAACGQHRPRLVITETRLGARLDECGLALVEAVRKRHPELPIVVATAYPSVASAQQAIMLGATDFLVKPITAEEVLRFARGLDPVRPAQWMDVRAARNQYISQMLRTCGSVAKTARVLGLDRRSLRRMIGRTAR